MNKPKQRFPQQSDDFDPTNVMGIQDPTQMSDEELLLQAPGMAQAPAPQGAPPTQADVNAASQQPPTMSFDDPALISARHKALPIVDEPIPFNMEAPVSMGQQAAPKPSMAERMYQFLQSPEYKAQQKELQDASQKAIGEQRAGLSQNQDMLDKMRGQVSLQPLAKLVDTWTGSKMADGMETPQAQQEKLMALQNQLQTQRQGITTEQLNYLKDRLGGAMSPLTQMKNLATMEYQNRYNPGEAMQQLTEFRAAQTARAAVLQKLATNKPQATRLAAYQTLDNALANMAAGQVRTPQQLQDFQRAVIAGLGMARGTSGVSERAEQYFDNLGLKGSRMKQLVFGTPQDIMGDAGSKDLVAHLQGLARQEQVNMRNQYQKGLGALGGAGYEDLWEKYPQIKSSLDNAVRAYADQMDSPSIPDVSKLKPGQTAVVGGKPKPFAPQPAMPKKKHAQMSDQELDNALMGQ